MDSDKVGGPRHSRRYGGQAVWVRKKLLLNFFMNCDLLMIAFDTKLSIATLTDRPLLIQNEAHATQKRI